MDVSHSLSHISLPRDAYSPEGVAEWYMAEDCAELVPIADRKFPHGRVGEGAVDSHCSATEVNMPDGVAWLGTSAVPNLIAMPWSSI